MHARDTAGRSAKRTPANTAGLALRCSRVPERFRDEKKCAPVESGVDAAVSRNVCTPDICAAVLIGVDAGPVHRGFAGQVCWRFTRCFRNVPCVCVEYPQVCRTCV
jgi:hypothetical protein